MKSYGQFTKFVDGRNELQMDVFIWYYYKNLQIRYTVKGEIEHKVEAGDPISYFQRRFPEQEDEIDYQISVIQKLAGNKELDAIQDKLEEKGIQCCMLNMYVLCDYLKFLARNRIFLLLKPQVKDTLAEIKDLASITFTNKDGSTTTNNNDRLMKIVLDTIKEKQEELDKMYEVDRLVKWNKIANNEIMQAIFVHDLTYFLHSYFPIKRKKGSLITTEEQELIRFFLYLFELSPAKVSASRYRQLVSIYNEIDVMPTANIIQDSKNDREGVFLFDYLSYNQWKTGKIDFKNNGWDRDSIKVGANVKFGNNVIIEE